jgi:hypothetical protein
MLSVLHNYKYNFSFVGHVNIISNLATISWKDSSSITFLQFTQNMDYKITNIIGHYILYVLCVVLRLYKNNCLELNGVSGPRIFSQWGLGLSGSVGVGVTDYRVLLAC